VRSVVRQGEDSPLDSTLRRLPIPVGLGRVSAALAPFARRCWTTLGSGPRKAVDGFFTHRAGEAFVDETKFGFMVSHGKRHIKSFLNLYRAYYNHVRRHITLGGPSTPTKGETEWLRLQNLIEEVMPNVLN